MAAFRRPFRKTRASFDCRLNSSLSEQGEGLLEVVSSSVDSDDQLGRGNLPDIFEEVHDLGRVRVECHSHVLGLIRMRTTCHFYSKVKILQYLEIRSAQRRRSGGGRYCSGYSISCSERLPSLVRPNQPSGKIKTYNENFSALPRVRRTGGFFASVHSHI